MRLIAILLITSIASQAADTVSAPAYALINARTSQNQSQFFVYEDVDSPFNHGFPSGLFGSSTAAMGKLNVNPGCVYSATVASGCSTDPTALDRTRGTVFQFIFAPLTSGDFVGLNFEEPQNWGATQTGIGYDLTGATQLVFDAISPSGGIQVQFSVNGAASAYMSIPQQWTTLTINLNSLGLTSLTGVHLLFGIASSDVNAPRGGTILLDNIHFLPVPTSQKTAAGLPLANQVFGIEHVQNTLPGSIQIPPDQTNSNLSTLYESSLAIIALIDRGQALDLTNAKLIADTLVYALGHDNQGDPLPALGGTAGLHNGTYAGDVALFNSQGPQAGQQGQVRLAGFTAAGECPTTGFCLLLDGATGGNNAFAILGLLAAYRQFQNPGYLNAALTIGNWIYGNLLDSSGAGYGGYYTGFPDQGLPKILETGKSTENNADIFAAFTALANVENAAGSIGAGTLWTTRANIAGDFVMQMYSAAGHFFAGTVPSTPTPVIASGVYPTGMQKGNDVINTFDFLDTDTFTVLAMAPASRYRSLIDWHLPVQWVLNHFQSSVTAANVPFQGFDLIQASEHLVTDGPAGIAWEFTGQEVAAMKLVDTLYGTSQFVTPASTYLSQIQQAQMSAPFTDSQGIVAATLQNGQAVAPYQQCLVTPYQCIAQRVGLAATIWAIAGERGLDPLLTTALPVQLLQTIMFGAPGIQSLGTGPFPLSASASSGLQVTFVSNSLAVCSVSGVNVTPIAVGTCSITASQSGDSTYAAAPSVTQTFPITPQAVPSITSGGIVPVYSTVPVIQSGEWVSIYGTNLAGSTATWVGNFPVSLGGTSVTINGKPAYLWFVSPTQINLQAPNDTATGSVSVVVTTGGGSVTSTATLASFAPSFSLLDSKHVAGIILRSNGAYDVIGPTGNSLGYATVAAKAGDTIAIFGVGLGPTSPTVLAGQAFSGAAPTINAVKLLINNVSVTPTFAGLSSAGLYQINLIIPAGLGAGDISLVATVGGVQTPSGVVISIQ